MDSKTTDFAIYDAGMIEAQNAFPFSVDVEGAPNRLVNADPEVSIADVKFAWINRDSGTVQREAFSTDEYILTIDLTPDDGAGGRISLLTEGEFYLWAKPTGDSEEDSNLELVDTDGDADGVFKTRIWPDFHASNLQVLSGIKATDARYVPASENDTTMMIRVEENTSVSISTVGVVPAENSILVLDEDHQTVGQWSGGTLMVDLQFGQNYAVILQRSDEDRVIVVENLNPQRVLQAAQNVLHPTGVDASGDTTPLDALLVINRLQLSQSNDLPTEALKDRFYDVDSSEHVTPLDALLVINKLSRAGREAEGEESRLSALESHLSIHASLTNTTATIVGREQRAEFPLEVVQGKSTQDLKLSIDAISENVATHPVDLALTKDQTYHDEILEPDGLQLLAETHPGVSMNVIEH